MTRDPLYSAIANTVHAAVPAVLLLYQQDWIADESQLKVAEKSRRVGLTWAEASDNVLIAARDRSDGGQNVYYIGYNMDMAIEYIEACGMWARIFDKAGSAIEEGEEIFKDENDAEKRIKTFTIKFPSGQRIVALSSRPANLRGKQGVVVIDEAAFHDKLEELIKAAIALLIWGGKVRIISTHNGENSPFNELIQEIRAGKRAGTVHRIDFKQAVEQGLYQRVCMRLNKDFTPEAEDLWVAGVYKFYGSDAAEELDVLPSSGAGAYLSRAQIIASQDPDIPVIRWAQDDAFAMMDKHLREAECAAWCEENLLPVLVLLPKNRKHYYGLDFARKADLCDFWPVQEQDDCSLRTPFLVELRNIPYEQQKQILFYIVKRLPMFRGGAHDATGNGGYLAEVAAQEFGAVRIHQIMLNSGWYIENMPRFKAHFEDHTITTPADADVLADLRGVKKIKSVPKVPDDAHTTGADGKQRHGDAAIALVLATYAVEMIDAGEIAFTPVPQHTRGFDNVRKEDDSDDLRVPEPQAW